MTPWSSFFQVIYLSKWCSWVQFVSLLPPWFWRLSLQRPLISVINMPGLKLELMRPGAAQRICVLWKQHGKVGSGDWNCFSWKECGRGRNRRERQAGASLNLRTTTDGFRGFWSVPSALGVPRADSWSAAAMWGWNPKLLTTFCKQTLI